MAGGIFVHFFILRRRNEGGENSEDQSNPGFL